MRKNIIVTIEIRADRELEEKTQGPEIDIKANMSVEQSMNIKRQVNI